MSKMDLQKGNNVDRTIAPGQARRSGTDSLTNPHFCSSSCTIAFPVISVKERQTEREGAQAPSVRQVTRGKQHPQSWPITERSCQNERYHRNCLVQG